MWLSLKMSQNRFIFVHDPLFTKCELLKNVKCVVPTISYVNDIVSYVFGVD